MSRGGGGWLRVEWLVMGCGDVMELLYECIVM